jgi:hypothetical protein
LHLFDEAATPEIPDSQEKVVGTSIFFGMPGAKKQAARSLRPLALLELLSR